MSRFVFVFYDDKRSEQWNFLNNGYCVQLIKNAISKGERFYQAASTDNLKSNYEKINLNILRTSKNHMQIIF